MTRECVTEETLKSWEAFQKNPDQTSDCQHRILESSAKSVRMAVTCQGGATKGTMQFTAASPEKIDGTVDMVHTEAGVERPMKMTISSRWLAADCGTVRPQ